MLLTNRVYLDHAATTPMLPEAIAAMAEGLARWANPSSPHAEGRAARAALEDARGRIKAALGWKHDLIFTSGASEALAIVLGRAKANHKLISAVEHDAVSRAAPGAEIIPVSDGEIDLDSLSHRLKGDGRAVVAIQHINPETGTNLLPYVRNPAVERVRAADGIVLADCSQSAGKHPLPDADIIVVSAHKLGGPPGIGAILLRDLSLLEASGGQELGYRGGTENLPGALGFAAALEVGGIERWATSAEQRFAFKDKLYGGGEVLALGAQCSHIFAVAMDHLSAKAQLIQLDTKGFSISAGSACSSGTMKRSRVLEAFGIAPEIADRTVRISIGWNTTSQDLDRFATAWLEIAASARARAA